MKEHTRSVLIGLSEEKYRKFSSALTPGEEHMLGVRLPTLREIAQELAKADYCMLFSVKEDLPISLIEATMMGVPIICNDVGGNLEIAKDGYNAFVCNEWDELVERLNSLPKVTDEEYKVMSQNSRTQYEQNFNFESFKRNYIEYLKKIMN